MDKDKRERIISISALACNKELGRRMIDEFTSKIQGYHNDISEAQGKLESTTHTFIKETGHVVCAHSRAKDRQIELFQAMVEVVEKLASVEEVIAKGNTFFMKKDIQEQTFQAVLVAIKPILEKHVDWYVCYGIDGTKKKISNDNAEKNQSEDFLSNLNKDVSLGIYKDRIGSALKFINARMEDAPVNEDHCSDLEFIKGIITGCSFS